MESSLTLPRAKHRHTNPKGRRRGPCLPGPPPHLHNVILPPRRSQSRPGSLLAGSAGPRSLISIPLAGGSGEPAQVPCKVASAGSLSCGVGAGEERGWAGQGRAEPGRRRGTEGKGKGYFSQGFELGSASRTLRSFITSSRLPECARGAPAAPSQGRCRVLFRCSGTSGAKVEETGDPGQKKQDAHARCPPLRFEEGVVGWKTGAGGWGWELAEGTAFALGGVWGTWALPLTWPLKRVSLWPLALRPQALEEVSSCAHFSRVIRGCVKVK